MLPRVDCKRDPTWLAMCCQAVREQGCCIVESTLPRGELGKVREAMYRSQERIVAEVGAARLERAGERGVLRLMMKFEPQLLQFLELPELLAIVDEQVSPTAILHLQNGFILPPESGEPGDIFQQKFHQDFPRRFEHHFCMRITWRDLLEVHLQSRCAAVACQQKDISIHLAHA